LGALGASASARTAHAPLKLIMPVGNVPVASPSKFHERAVVCEVGVAGKAVGVAGTGVALGALLVLVAARVAVGKGAVVGEGALWSVAVGCGGAVVGATVGAPPQAVMMNHDAMSRIR
jgi:hypothetical protein